MASPVELDLDRLEDALLGVLEPRTEEDRSELEKGGAWPVHALTMIGRARMRNIRRSVETVIRDQVPGDLIEAGAWRGGACIYMRAIVAAHGENRGVWAADSFDGLPEFTHPADKSDDALREMAGELFAVSREEVSAKFADYGLLDDDVHLVEGLFRETLPGLTGPWAVVRLDGDLYESTMDGLRHLYPSLSPGGFLIVDDYGTFDGCRLAVDEYRQSNGITEPIEWTDATEVFWRRRS